MRTFYVVFANDPCLQISTNAQLADLVVLGAKAARIPLVPTNAPVSQVTSSMGSVVWTSTNVPYQRISVCLGPVAIPKEVISVTVPLVTNFYEVLVLMWTNV